MGGAQKPTEDFFDNTTATCNREFGSVAHCDHFHSEEVAWDDGPETVGERPMDVEDIDAVLQAPAGHGDDTEKDVGNGEKLVSDLAGFVRSAFVVSEGFHADGSVAETVHRNVINFVIGEAFVRRCEDADGADLAMHAADEFPHPGNLAVIGMTSVGGSNDSDVEI